MTMPKIRAHYKRGPQGNIVADHKADMLALYGPLPTVDGPLGTPEIQDRRDNRDPAELGERIIARSTAKANGKT